MRLTMNDRLVVNDRASLFTNIMERRDPICLVRVYNHGLLGVLWIRNGTYIIGARTFANESGLKAAH